MKKSIPIQLFIVFVLSACFSPWQGDEAELTIVLGNTDPSRNLINTAGGEQNSFAYEVILTGTGRTAHQVFMPMAPLILKVFPGKYSIEVRALEASGFTLRGVGETPAPIEIRVGKNVVPLTMTSATVVTSWGNAATVGSLYYEVEQGSRRGSRPEIFVLKKGGDWTINSGCIISITRSVTLVAEDNVEIERTCVMDVEFFDITSGGKLILKCKTGGSLTLNGSKPPGGTQSCLIHVNGGTLEMNNGVTLKDNNVPVTNFYGGGVYVFNGTFIMNGGIITNNSAGNGTSDNGGGVYVSNGTFIMNGGTISGNKTSAGGSGGGVFVTSGTFTMNGGTIGPNNEASQGGGGVYIAVSTSFTMTGGIITGNKVTGSSRNGGGVNINTSGFTMTGGAITGNHAAGTGGGVYVSGPPFPPPYGTFEIRSPAGKGSVRGNTAASDSQVSVVSGGVFKVNGIDTGSY